MELSSMKVLCIFLKEVMLDELAKTMKPIPQQHNTMSLPTSSVKTNTNFKKFGKCLHFWKWGNKRQQGLENLNSVDHLCTPKEEAQLKRSHLKQSNRKKVYLSR